MKGNKSERKRKYKRTSITQTLQKPNHRSKSSEREGSKGIKQGKIWP